MSAERLPVLSASKLKTFVMCGRKYKYQYIEHVPVMKHPAAALGTAVHAAIDAVFKQPQDPIKCFIDAFDKELRDSFILLNYDEYERLRTDGIKMVGDYDYSVWKPTATEVEFNLPFPNNNHPICRIHGFMDQVYGTQGFVDLKTNKQKPKQEDLDKDLQFIIYQWAFKELYGVLPEYCTWYHLRTQEPIQAAVNDRYDQALAAINDLLRTKQEDTFTKNRAFHCRFCPFRDPCFSEDCIE